MKPTNGKASTIMIRDLSKKDNVMLKQVREDFKTEFNTVAVMKGVAGYLEQKKVIAEQREEISKQETEIQTLNTTLSQLRSTVNQYFEFQITAVQRQSELSQLLKKMVDPTLPKKAEKAAPGKPKRRKGLSDLRR